MIGELEKWGDGIDEKPRWLVLNKIDALPEEEVESHCQAIVDALGWTGPVFRISALEGKGLKPLTYKIMDFLEEQKAEDAEEE